MTKAAGPPPPSSTRRPHGGAFPPIPALLPNLVAAGRLVARKPQLFSVAAHNVSYRLIHRVVRARTRGWTLPPEQITVVATDICNLRCKMCQYAFSEDPSYQLNRLGKLPFALFRKVMDEIPGRPLVTFTGGEPLINTAVPEFIAYAKRKGRFCTLTTNGWFLADHARALCDAGLDILIVSVDGPPDVHDQIRGPRSFERLTQGIEAILREPRRPIVLISMAITEMNDDRLLDSLAQARAFGVDGMNFNHLWSQVDEVVEAHNGHHANLFTADRVAWSLLPNRIDTELVADQLERARSRRLADGFLILESPFLTRRQIGVWYRDPARFVKWNTTRCAWMRLKLTPDGKVKPCRGWEAGDLTQEHAMRIWNGPQLRLFRQTLASRGTFPICARCCALAHR